MSTLLWLRFVNLY